MIVYDEFCDDGSIEYGFKFDNSTNKAKVLEWIDLYKSQFNINLYDMNADYSLIALQGPQSRNILQKI